MQNSPAARHAAVVDVGVRQHAGPTLEDDAPQPAEDDDVAQPVVLPRRRR